MSKEDHYFKPGHSVHRPKGSWNKDPDACVHQHEIELKMQLPITETRRCDWIAAYFALRPSDEKTLKVRRATLRAVIKMAINMLFELTVAHEKGFDLYMERKIGGKVYRRRIIIE